MTDEILMKWLLL